MASLTARIDAGEPSTGTRIFTLYAVGDPLVTTNRMGINILVPATREHLADECGDRWWSLHAFPASGQPPSDLSTL
jgi:hypothetical protein